MSERKRSGELVGASETSGKLAELPRLQWKSLKMLGLPNEKG